MSDLTHGLFQLLESWAPLLIFMAVWLFVMRRYTGQYKQPWDQIERRLERSRTTWAHREHPGGRPWRIGP